MFKLRPYQQKATDWCFEHLLTEGNCLLVAPTGCHAKGTMVLKYPGQFVPVEDVKVGDCLVGDDGKERHVLRLCRGFGRMYKITPTKGQPFVVNEEHVLSLVCNDIKNPNYQKVIDITVKEYIETSNYYKWTHKLYRYKQGLKFDSQEVIIPPHFLGVLIGDGGITHQVNLYTPEPELIKESYKIAPLFDLKIHKELQRGCYMIGFRRTKNHPGCRNKLKQELQKLGLMCGSGYKFIPDLYKYNSTKVRLEVLAGLLDTDGYYHNGYYEFCTVSDNLAKDVLYLAGSVGLATTRVDKFVNGKRYHRINIRGDVDKIPCVVERKICKNKHPNKDTTRTGFTIEYIGNDNYYGFELDGNHRYVMQDWFITHNSGKTVMLSDVAKRTLEYLARELGRPAHGICLIGQNEIHQQNLRTFNKYAPNIRTAVFDSNIKSCKGNMIFAMIASIYKYRNKLPMFDFVICDESHRAIAPQEFEFIKTLKAKNPKLLVFGVTATPNRGDKVGLLPLFTNYYRIPIGLLFKCGYLVKPIFKVFGSTEPTTEDGHKRFLESVHANKVGKTVVFCRDVATALMYKDLWNSLYENEPAVCVHGELSSGERADVIDKFKSGVAPIIFNVAVLTEGFDEPKIETAVLAKHYGTKGQYIQAVGRALRSAPGKTRAYILDYCGNYTEHGDLQENVDLEGEGKSVKGRNVVLDDLYEGGDVAQNDEVKVDFKESAPQYFTPYGEDLECINWFECDGMGIVGALNTQGLGIIIVGEDCYITHDKVNFEKVPIENLGKMAKNSITTEDKPATAYQLKYLAGKYNIVGITKNRADSVILFDLWRQFS